EFEHWCSQVPNKACVLGISLRAPRLCRHTRNLPFTISCCVQSCTDCHVVGRNRNDINDPVFGTGFVVSDVPSTHMLPKACIAVLLLSLTAGCQSQGNFPHSLARRKD